MRAFQYHRLARALQDRTTTLLLRQLRPRDFSRLCPALVLLSCLVLAAAHRLSLAAVAALRRRCPSRETLRQALFATLPAYAELRRRLAALLRASLPRGLARRPRRRYPMALDLHRVAYYKRGRTPPAHARKGQRLAGTRYAHDYATASLLRKGQYYVVAVTPFDPGETLADVTRRLLRQAAGLGFVPRYVLMDRTFWSADVFRYLQRARYPFLIPVQARGKTAAAPGGPTGTQAFFHGRESGRYSYRVANRRKQTAALTILVQRRNHGGREGRHGRYAWVYAAWRVDLATARSARESYRRRFRIESSYRLLETGRGRTSSRDEGWRLWYVALAVLLVNQYLTLRREASRAWGRGEAGRCWCLELLAALAQLLLGTPAAPAAANPSQTPGPQ